MITITNYHKESVKIENQYQAELLVPFGDLLTQLNSIDVLKTSEINNTVNLWKIQNLDDIQQINKIFVEKAEEVANEQIPPLSSNQNERKADLLVVANDQMLNVTTESIRQKFIELAVLEQNYNYNTEQSTEFVQSIARTTEDKIELFSTMSVIGNIKEFLFGNAMSHDFTEYLWRTQRDSRVRSTHVYMDNKWVRLDEAPQETGYYHVGQDYNCRCWASKFR